MTVFITIALGAFMTDFQASAGAPLLVPQALEWETSPTHVNYAGNLNLLLLWVTPFAIYRLIDLLLTGSTLTAALAGSSGFPSCHPGEEHPLYSG